MDSYPSSTMLIKRIRASRLAVLLPWIVCGLAATFYFYELCLRVALGTMVPEVSTALNISMGQIGILSAFYYYAYTPMQIAAGALLDRLGPRNLLITMVLLCAAGSFLFGHTSLFAIAAIAQLCIGFASAFAFVGVMKLASNWLPVKYFSLISGLTTSLGMVGAMLSNILIAFAMRSVGWRGVWYAFAVLGILLMVVFFLMCVNQPAATPNSKRVKKLYWSDIRQDFILMIRSSYFWINAIIGGLLYFPTTAFAGLWGIPYLTTTYNFDKVTASTIVSMIFFGWAVGGPIAGWMSERVVSKKNLLVYGSLCAFLTMVLALCPLNFNKVELAIVLFLFGLFSSVEVLVFDVAARLFSGRSAGTAASITNFIVMLVCTVFQPVIGFFINTNQTAQQYRLALIIIPVGLLLAMIFAAFIYKEQKAQVGSIVPAGN